MNNEKNAAKKYNKLVRDKIPSIIELNGEKPKTHILSDADYMKELKLKLQEEVNEFLASENIEELADIIEVIHGIAKAKNINLGELENIRIIKRNKNGGFEKRIFLEDVGK